MIVNFYVKHLHDVHVKGKSSTNTVGSEEGQVSTALYNSVKRYVALIVLITEKVKIYK